MVLIEFLENLLSAFWVSEKYFIKSDEISCSQDGSWASQETPAPKLSLKSKHVFFSELV